jgi:alginate O-acetyltransferase complex protein AlgI
MNFASPAFFVFLPVVLLAYHRLTARDHKYRFLLVASWLLYASWNPWFLWVILFTTAVDHAAGMLIESASTPTRRRAWLVVSLVSNLSFLACFKYTNFAFDNSMALARWLGWGTPDWTLEKIVLPLGISFHTFQGISYTLDVYRGRIRAVRGFVDFAVFVAFFPQLVAGPIVRAMDFLPQMATPPRVSVEQVVEGLHWFLIGLFKKVFIADRLAQFVDPVFAHPELYDAVTLRWGVLAYAAQIYCDFSGYSDLAIGCAKWFGFELPINFNFPYVAGSISDFWRRWHISLSSWLRDYLYIPLGGSRRSAVRTYFNLIVTMTLCGLWHGASWNYVLWGFYNGLLLSFHRIGDRALVGKAWAIRIRSAAAYRVLATATTLLFVFSGFILVRTENWAGCWGMQCALFGGGSEGDAHRVPAQVPLLVALVMLGHLFSGLRPVRCGILALPPLARSGAYVAAVLLLVVFAPGTAKSFIYFQF